MGHGHQRQDPEVQNQRGLELPILVDKWLGVCGCQGLGDGAEALQNVCVCVCMCVFGNVCHAKESGSLPLPYRKSWAVALQFFVTTASSAAGFGSRHERVLHSRG